MKILTLTTYQGYNYGASLQAYALQTFLKSQGHETAIIRYEPEYLMRHYAFWYVNPESSLNRNCATRMLYRVLKWAHRRTTLKRKRVFDFFNHQVLQEDAVSYKNSEELMANPPSADTYICGSDQIWNVLYEAGRDPVFYLEFVRQGKRVSYAASFSYLDLPQKEITRISDSLRKFDAVSTREYQGKELLCSMGIDSEWVLDPVFLLSTSDWNTLVEREDILCLEKNNSSNEPYLLIYDFEGNIALKDFAQEYARKHHLKIYAIIDRFPLRYADRNIKNAGPADFVRFIKNCDCFISNSFHGTAFSIIYHKPFYVFKREKAMVNSRMESLLMLFGLKDRMVTGTESVEGEIDWENVEKVKSVHLAQSLNFLKEVGV